MFEDFSFVSSTTTISPESHYTLTSYIDQLDPLSPGTPEAAPLSPTSSFSSAVPSSSPPRGRDDRFQASRTTFVDTSNPSRRFSVDTLTNQFINHSPFDVHHESSNQPRSAPIEEDEGFDEPASNHLHAAAMDCIDSIVPLSAFDYSISSLSSSASTCTSRPLGFAARRRQRQLLSRLQCLTSGNLDSHLTMLMEECHPSSLPLVSPDSDSERANGGGGGNGRKQSITSVGNSSLAWNLGGSRHDRPYAIVKRAPRIRKRKS